MGYFIPLKSPEWDELRDLLRSFVDSDLNSASSDKLRYLLIQIYQVFTGVADSDKFDDVPDMMHAVSPDVASRFMSATLKRICHDLLDELPHAFEDSMHQLPFLVQEDPNTVSFTPRQAYLLLAMCFFCIPLEDSNGRSTMRYGTCCLMYVNRPKQVAKLTCLLNYFNIIVACQLGHLDRSVSEQIISPDNRRIELVRIVSLKSHGGEWWCNQTSTKLSALILQPKGSTIESIPDAVHADFANKHIGGGVLRKGAVQEEIRMMISPESLLAVFLCDPMMPNEAVLIRNTIRFSAYSGYAQSFTCTGISAEILACMENHTTIPKEEIICIDAIPFGINGEQQFSLPCILRELEKCRLALSSNQCTSKVFATGNWGCGIFGGDPQMKAVIQWLAASVAGKTVVYCPFDNPELERLPELVECGVNESVGSVFQAIVENLTNNKLSGSNTIDILAIRIRTKTT